MSPKQRPGTRTHVVLVPGFGGFDALGQIRYYGHYRQVPCSSRPGRRFSAYDLLRSGSGFGDEQFRSVWREVLEFSVGEEGGA